MSQVLSAATRSLDEASEVAAPSTAQAVESSLVSQRVRVRCKGKCGAQWRTGTVTSTNPLEVQVDDWDSAHCWDQVEAKHELEATLALSRLSLSSDVQPPVAPRDSAKPDSLVGFATQRALPRSGGERAEEQQTQALVSQRAAELNLPERLTLGLSVDAIESYIAALPADAVEQCNENRPTINGVRVPANGALNGYVNQWLVARFSEANGGKAYCETLYERGDPGVGVATVFVSWFLETPLATLVDALRQYLRLHPELPPDTKFWVCDFVIRQSTRQLDVTMNDVKRLGDCVRAVGHTVLLMEPFDNPMPLRRAGTTQSLCGARTASRRCSTRRRRALASRW
uniref:Uncharacterized protein n=1 Tax=Emiliania huxleyi TaxID=2903 RepID=A0A7S3X3M3_EMIHU